MRVENFMLEQHGTKNHKGVILMTYQELWNDIITWAQKPPEGAGDFTSFYTVWATVTLHGDKAVLLSQGGPAKPSSIDVVWYANSPLSLQTENGQPILKANMDAYTNSEGATITCPLIRNNPLSIALTVRGNGQITIGQLIDGKNFLGRAPTTFSATVVGKMISNFVKLPMSGEVVCTISFSKVKNTPTEIIVS